MDDFDFLFDTIDKWSFSRLNSYYNCPYEWKRIYLDMEVKEQNAFSQYGSFCHKILELYEKNILSLFDLVDYYEKHFFEEVYLPFPPNKYTDLQSAYYEKGYEFFSNIDLMLDKYNILGVEKKVEFKIDGKDFIGYIDLLLQDKVTKEITILDHKSASIKFKKDNKPSKKDEEHYKSFIRQLTLYAIPVLEQYGRVDYIGWNFFRDQTIHIIPFDKDSIEEAKQWASDTIKTIAEDTLFVPNPDSFYCRFLCSQRNNMCPYKA